MPNSNELFSIFDPSTLAIAMDAPVAPFLASNINEIFSGISPAIGLIITDKMIVDTPTSSENPSSELINGPAPAIIPIVLLGRLLLALISAC